MKKMLWTLGLLGLAQVAMADTPLNLHYGVNEVDINGDGTKDIIVKARWDNGNAHSFDHYLMMMNLKGRKYYEEGYYEVPKGAINEIGTPDYKFHSSEGADCLRVGYKFALDVKNMLVVTRYALADGEESYCEAQKAMITTYKLIDNIQRGEEGAGLPPFYLEAVKDKKLLKKYESVEELMK